MSDFAISNTVVADQLVNPVYGASWNPVFTSQNLPGTIQFSNFNVQSAHYTQIDKVVTINVRLTCNVDAPGGEPSGQMQFTPPVFNITTANSAIGAMTTLSQVGFFGNLSKTGQALIVDCVNVVGIINVPNAVIQVLGSYMVQ